MTKVSKWWNDCEIGAFKRGLEAKGNHELSMVQSSRRLQ